MMSCVLPGPADIESRKPQVNLTRPGSRPRKPSGLRGTVRVNHQLAVGDLRIAHLQATTISANLLPLAELLCFSQILSQVAKPPLDGISLRCHLVSDIESLMGRQSSFRKKLQ